MGLLSSQAWDPASADPRPDADVSPIPATDHQPPPIPDANHPDPDSPSAQSSSSAVVDEEKLPIPTDEKAREKPNESSDSSWINEKAIEEPAPAPVVEDEPTSKDETRQQVARTASTATASSDGGPPEDEDESKYPKAWALATLTTALALVTFMIALDNTIIATAIPRITTVFNSVNDVGWYGSSYLLTTTSLQPSFGKVYTYFNIKWTYIIAMAIFELGSTICGAAQTSDMLIIGRAVAGVGAAALFSGSLIIVAYAVPLRKRAIYIALLSSMFGISSVVGPILGGAFTDHVSWRWCFFINLPIGGISISVVFFFFKNPERKHSKLTLAQKIGNIDLLGALFLISAIVCLLLALQWGGTVYHWHDARVWGCLLGFGLLIIIFTSIQFYKGEKATIPPRIILKQRTVFGCAFFSAFLAMALYTHIYFLPFYFQAVKGTTAQSSGIRTVPYLVSNTLAAIVVGGSITFLGPYVPFLWGGSAVFCVGAGLLYTLQVHSGAGKWIGYQILAGVGAGACVQIPFIAVQVVLNKKDMPVGNAVAIFFNTLGGAISISIAQNIFSNTLIKEVVRYAPGVNPQVIIDAGATHVREVVSKAQLPGVLQAYDLAVTRAFVLSIACTGIAFCVSFIFEWKSVKGRKLEMGAAA